MFSDSLCETINRTLRDMIYYKYSVVNKDEIFNGLAYLYIVQYDFDHYNVKKINLETAKNYIIDIYEELLKKKLKISDE